MDIIHHLQQRGVSFLQPQSVYIAPDVQPERIAPEGVVIYPGCRLEGAETLVLGGVRLGEEGPAHVKNCLLGEDVALKGGYFEGALFLSKAQMGLGAHVRPGTILEEGARGAHCVALKQTILFPFVTLGSLINFCDCFMAGGTSASDHSEVGSSFIHFNYTPNQDKATPSLIGDVPRGVMLDQHPIFLGGQGGVVGPCRVAYGTVTAAGATLRHDILAADQIVLDGLRRAVKLKSTPGKYANIQRLVSNNLHYIANLAALAQWYRQVRALFVGKSFPPELLAALRANLNVQIEERIRRLGQLASKMERSHPLSPPESREQQRQKEFHQCWPQIEARLAAHMAGSGPTQEAEHFLHRLTGDGRFSTASYLEAIQGAAPETKSAGRRWLQRIVDALMDDVQQILPAFLIQ